MREEMGSEIKKYFQDYNIKKEFRKPLRNLYMKNQKNKEAIEKIKSFNLKENKKTFWKKYKKDFNKVDTLISFLSLSNQSMHAFEKTLYIFDKKIKKLILLCTPRTEKTARKFKYNNVDIEIIKLEDVENFSMIHNRIYRYIQKENLFPNRILIDNTMGFKMISLAFYKISTELNIKTINWKQVQFKNPGNGRKTFIVPGSDKINVILKPKLENYLLYRDIDTALEDYNFQAAAFLYKQINNIDKYNFFEICHSIFSYPNLMDYNLFEKAIKNSYDRLKNINFTKETINITSGLCSVIKSFLPTKIIKKEIYSFDDDNPQNFNFGIKIEENAKFILWRLLSIEILKKKVEDKRFITNIIIDKFLDEDIDVLNIDSDIKKKIYDFISDEDFSNKYIYMLYDFMEQLDIQEEIESINIDKKLMGNSRYYKFIKKALDLKQSISENIIFQNGYINFLKYNIKVKEKKLFSNSMINRFLRKLVIDLIKTGKKKSKKEIYNDLEKFYIKIKGDINADYTSAIYKSMSRLWNDYTTNLNKKIKEEFEKNYINCSEDFLVKEDDKLKINEFFLERY